MNEGKKTAIFWIAAALMLGIGAVVSWPPSKTQQSSETAINTDLFGKFKDPLTAASMKIVTFDEAQGSLETFEVRKDRQTGAWTIPSRDGYPADAVEQMKDAANSLVDLKILETIFAEPSDHEDFGVVEPNLEDLNVGDEGVGRLVTFKDSDQKTLASLIIGDGVKDQEGQLYVRKPNQDPVYVVSLNDKPLTTKFQDWIEDDLLKLSSIDIKEMQVKDYSTNMNPLSGQISLVRKYDADLAVDGSNWKLEALKEYDPKNPLAEPKAVEVAEEEKLNSTKLNAVKNALDDVKIANVVRKPEGMSANLKADKELAADQKAVQSLASHGFYPVQLGQNGETEILSANGELVVGLNDGVEYVLRFGNISGLSEEGEGESDEEKRDEEKSSGGVNRYLLVTTRVNDANFPPPELKPIPQKVEDLEAFRKEEEKPEPEETPVESKTKEAETADPKAEDKKPEETPEEPLPDEPEPSKSEPAEEKAADKATDGDQDAPAEKEGDAATSGETEVSGGGEGSGTGQGQDPDDEAGPQQGDASAEETDEPEAAAKVSAEEPKAEEAAGPAEQAKGDEQVTKGKVRKNDAPAETSDDEEMSEEEKQELLEAEQEKITKENQRKLDERKDKIEAATKRVRDLNARFADWYYVIPEDTYTKLRVKRDELFENKESDKAAAPPGLTAPQFPQ